MAVQAETGESASDSGIKQVEVEAAAPISEVIKLFPSITDCFVVVTTLL
jgi:hypothetical protein